MIGSLEFEPQSVQFYLKAQSERNTAALVLPDRTDGACAMTPLPATNGIFGTLAVLSFLLIAATGSLG